MPAPTAVRFFAVSSLLYAAALWGLVWYPYRLLAEAGVGGMASSFFSYAIPLALLGVWHGRALMRARGRWLWLVALALAAGWTNIAYVFAMLEGEVVRVLLLFFLAPLWTVLFAWLLLRETLNRAGWAVMALAAGGGLVMLWQPGDWPLPANRAEWLALSAGMLFAVSNVVSRHLQGVAEGARAVAVWSGVTVLAAFGLSLEPSALDFATQIEASTWLLLVGVALLIASMTYAVQYGLARVPANQAIVIFLSELVVAAVSAYFLAGERMGMQEWAGAAMIVTASLFSGHMSNARQEPTHV